LFAILGSRFEYSLHYLITEEKMKNNAKEFKLKNSIETAFRKYYERCTGKELDHLNDKQLLLLLDAIYSGKFLKFLYCHL